MPTPTVQILLRLKPGAVEWLDKIAADTNQSRTAVIRHALATARKYEPELVDSLESQP